ncbi:hypothetical protein [Bacillus sp. FJAT-45350]|uniref:hypothetical protein n=1 Tax=Bacillus sp. FJAT-45350 TaxID=2011014 RepID=UPI000BB9715A|nr:hypothetical protein [Bacillus sp. FJAT-45350]
MKKSTILFTLLFIVTFFILTRIVNFVSMSFVQLWFTDPTGIQLLIMISVTIFLFLGTFLTAKKLTDYFNPR